MGKKICYGQKDMLKRMADALTQREIEAIVYALHIAKDTGKQAEILRKYGTYQNRVNS